MLSDMTFQLYQAYAVKCNTPAFSFGRIYLQENLGKNGARELNH